jgi:hypothetical protein
MIGIDPLDKAGPAQRLQSADVGTHESFGVLALPLKAVTDALQVPARPVYVVVLLSIGGDVAVGRSWTGDDWGRLDDHVAPDLLDPAGVLELHVVDTAIDAVDNQVNPLAHLVSGQTLGQDPADDLLASGFARWADHRKVPQITFKPDWHRHAKAAPFKRNDAMLQTLPIGILLAPGSGIQANLRDKARRLIQILRHGPCAFSQGIWAMWSADAILGGDIK